MTHLEWVTLLQGKRAASNQYNAKCPAHDDKTASLRINTAEVGKTLIHCHAGCTTEAICAAVGKEVRDLFYGDAPKQDTPSQQTGTSISVTTTQAQAIYDYLDTTGMVQLQKKRFPGKNFRWYHWDGGGWKDRREGHTPALYKAADVANQRVVWWAEGEKDADTLAAHGLPAVSAPDGAKSKLIAAQMEAMRGKEVVILPDNDAPGQSHAQAVAAMLQGIAASVRVLALVKVWPDLQEHGDVSDIYALMGEDTTEALQTHAAATPEWTQEAAEVQAGPPELAITSARDLMKEVFSPLIQAVDMLICEGLTMLVSASKVGKSWLVLLMAFCVARGEPFLGRRTTKCRVLYFALEDSKRRLQQRMRTMKLLDVPDNLYFVTKAQMLEAGFEEQLETWLSMEEGPALVILDTLQKVRGTTKGGVNVYQNDYEVIGALKAMADKYRAMFVLVHHTNKAKFVADPFEKISGSTGIMGASDTAIIIERERGQATATVKFEGRDAHGPDFVIRFNENCIWELVSNDASEYTAKNDYENEPLVMLFRKLDTENPSGGRWTYTNLQAISLEAFGHQPFIDGKDCAAKLNDGLAAELRKRDGILVECGIRVANARGIKLQRVSKIIAFPTRMQTDDE